MQLVVWNMAAGYGFSADRHRRAWEYLVERRPDVALLQECVVPERANQVWAGIVHRRVFEHQPWGSAVVARRDLREVRAEAVSPLGSLLSGGLVLAELDDDASTLCLASVHARASAFAADVLEGHDLQDLAVCVEGQVWPVDVAFHVLRGWSPGNPLLAGGDLNAALAMDDHPDPRFHGNDRLFANIAATGLVDTRVRQQVEEQQTFFREGNRPYQLDHVFADPSTELSVTKWTVDRSAVEDLDLSDHAPIWIELDF